MLLGVFTACFDGAPEKQNYEFSCGIAKTEYLRGEEIEFKASVKNISGKKLKYTGCSSYDYFPMAELYYLTDEGEYGGKLDFEPIIFTADVVEKTVERGEIGSYTYVIKIPDDAVCGDYSLELWFGGESRVFDNILRITDDDGTRLALFGNGGDLLRGLSHTAFFDIADSRGKEAGGVGNGKARAHVAVINTKISHKDCPFLNVVFLPL